MGKRTIPWRLHNAYIKLQKSKIVKNNIINEENIDYFQSILNSCLPKTDEEKNLYYFIKEQYHNNKGKFTRYYLSGEDDYCCFLLWTDNRNIMNHMKLQNKIFIKWDNTDKLDQKYIVEQFIPQNNTELEIENVIKEEINEIIIEN